MQLREIFAASKLLERSQYPEDALSHHVDNMKVVWFRYLDRGMNRHENELLRKGMFSSAPICYICRQLAFESLIFKVTWQ